MPILPQRLKEIRKAKNVSQKQVGEAIGIDERNYRGYENAETDPTTAFAARIADYFEVSIDYLVGRTDNPNINH